jgi:hypothetical protein
MGEIFMEQLKKVIAARVGVSVLLTIVFLAGCAQEEPSKPLEVKESTATGSKISLEMAEKGLPAKEEVPEPSLAPITEERTYYDFESGDLLGWEVPQWAEGQNGYVAISSDLSDEVASKGENSMKVAADFPGGSWSAALVEIQQYLDLSGYRVLMADIYLPPDAPVGLTAKIILTVGDNWRFVEMSRSFPLMPGEWVTVTGNIEPGSYDWKRIVPDEKFAEDVRKIAIRIESNMKPKYAGDVFIDNIRVGR